MNAKIPDLSENESAVYHADCRELLKCIPVQSLDLTVTSPPYAIGKEYESTRDPRDIESLLAATLPDLVEKTKLGGSICIQFGYNAAAQGLVPLDYMAYKVMESIGDVYLRNRIIWTFESGSHARKRFSGRHETILWFSKGKENFFDIDSVRVPQKYPGKKHYKGARRGQYSGNPLGKNPGDVWSIPLVHSSHPEKTKHPCQFPIALAQRLIRALSPAGGLVFDPFCGVATTGAAAILEGRRFIGCDTNMEYVRIAGDRLRQAKEGNLAYRPIEKPVLDPKTQGKVSIREE